MLASDAAISVLVKSALLLSSSGSLDILRTVAKPDRGRCRGPSLRCCHDNVPLLASPEAVGCASSVLEESETGLLVSLSGSLTGEVRPLTALARDRDFAC